MNIEELSTKGWAYVNDVKSDIDLMNLGKTIGCPTLTPNGEYIKEIKRQTKHEAPEGSQSALYGGGSFPLHTDTVFWPLPIRYLLLRAKGDLRRPTTIKNINDLLKDINSDVHEMIQNSVWVVGPTSKKIYCSMKFRYKDTTIWRYDADLMIPANSDALEIKKIIDPLVRSDDTEFIEWKENMAVIIDNWTVLHGRGVEPQDENVRVIERLYVR